MTLVAVSRFFQKLTKMNFAENKNMRSICLLHRPVCYYVGGYMRGKKKKPKSTRLFYSALQRCSYCIQGRMSSLSGHLSWVGRLRQRKPGVKPTGLNVPGTRVGSPGNRILSSRFRI